MINRYKKSTSSKTCRGLIYERDNHVLVQSSNIHLNSSQHLYYHKQTCINDHCSLDFFSLLGLPPPTPRAANNSFSIWTIGASNSMTNKNATAVDIARILRNCWVRSMLLNLAGVSVLLLIRYMMVLKKKYNETQNLHVTWNSHAWTHDLTCAEDKHSIVLLPEEPRQTSWGRCWWHHHASSHRPRLPNSLLVTRQSWRTHWTWPCPPGRGGCRYRAWQWWSQWEGCSQQVHTLQRCQQQQPEPTTRQQPRDSSSASDPSSRIRKFSFIQFWSVQGPYYRT